MKSFKEISKKYSPGEIAESYIFPPGLNKDQREQSLNVFREWRKQHDAQRSWKSKTIARLLQLRFFLEDFIK